MLYAGAGRCAGKGFKIRIGPIKKGFLNEIPLVPVFLKRGIIILRERGITKATPIIPVFKFTT